MELSTLVGELLKEKNLHKEKNGEKFYITYIRANDLVIPIMVSEFILLDAGRVAVQGYPIQYREAGVLHPMFYVTAMSKTENTVDCSTIQVKGRICFLHDEIVTKSCKQLRPFCLRFPCNNGYQVIKLCAVDKAARILSRAKKGDAISGSASYSCASNLALDMRDVLIQKM